MKPEATEDRTGTAGDGHDRLLLERQICFRLYLASTLMTRLYRPHLDEMGLTYAQYLVMLVLWETAPLSVGQIGARLFLDSGTLTPLLKRLEAAGLVVRRRDPGDERRVLVDLTDAGRGLRAAADRMLTELQANTCIALADIGPLSDQLDGFLDGLIDQLKMEQKPGG